VSNKKQHKFLEAQVKGVWDWESKCP